MTLYLGRRAGAVLTLSLWLSGCAPSGAQDSSTLEKDITESRAKLSVVPESGTKLRLLRKIAFPREHVLRPVALAATAARRVVISDNNAHGIHEVDLGNIKGTLKSGTRLRAGKFTWPTSIRSFGVDLFVLNSVGITLDSPGKEPEIIKPFYGFTDFDVISPSTFVGLADFSELSGDEPALILFGRDGSKISDFGLSYIPDKGKGFGRMLNFGTISYAEGIAAVAYRHRPVLTLFDLRRRQVKEIAVSHPSFGQLQSLDSNTRFTNPAPQRQRRCTYLAGVKSGQSGILVALEQPYVDLHLYSWGGSLQGRYVWEDSQRIRSYFGLDLLEHGNVLVVGVIYEDDSSALLLFDRLPVIVI
jgi:hypothetical protein